MAPNRQSAGPRQTSTSKRAAREARLASLHACTPFHLMQGSRARQASLLRKSRVPVSVQSKPARRQCRVEEEAGTCGRVRTAKQVISRASGETINPPQAARPTHASELTKSAKSKATRSDGVRAVRRGELDGISTKYKGIDDLSEFKMLCSELEKGNIKHREIDDLYRRGKISAVSQTVKDYVSGRADKKDKTKWFIRPGAWRDFQAFEDGDRRSSTDDYMLLGHEAEEMMLHVILRCHRRKKGLNEKVVKMWARAGACRSFAAIALSCHCPSLTGSCALQLGFKPKRAECTARASSPGTPRSSSA
mmetsp:Transcript_30536/g.97493  ORF Transcript_30536/g.97493 Transcript_30536/m.97493 type:complete len:306 (+) Transcript_30536:147-1064(+)